MRFAAPDFLWLLMLVPPLAMLALVVRARRRRALGQFAGGLDRLHHFTGQVSLHRRALKLLLVYLALIAIPLALARPQWGTRLEPVTRLGADIAVVLDTSLSMAAEDLAPTRLDHARHSINEVLTRIEGDRAGLVTFAGQAAVQCPLTVDKGAVRLFLEAADAQSVPVAGTALAGALRAAFRALEIESGAGERGRAILLYTDGEDHEGGLEEITKQLRDAGIPVYAVGTGTARGAPIPLRDQSGVLLDYKKDREGKVVTTRLAETVLERLALETGGGYYRATAGELEVDGIVAALGGLGVGELGTEMRAHYEDRFQVPLLIGALALLAETLLGDRRRSRFSPDAGGSAR